MQLRRREPATAEVGQDEQFEEIDGCVAPLGIAAGLRAAGRNRRRDEAASVPQLQLSRRQSCEGCHLARRGRLFQSQGNPLIKSPSYQFTDLPNLTMPLPPGRPMKHRQSPSA